MSEMLDWTFRGSRSGRKSQLKGYRIDKAGKIVKDVRRLDVSTRLKQKASKRVRPARKGEA